MFVCVCACVCVCVCVCVFMFVFTFVCVGCVRDEQEILLRKRVIELETAAEDNGRDLAQVFNAPVCVYGNIHIDMILCIYIHKYSHIYISR